MIDQHLADQLSILADIFSSTERPDMESLFRTSPPWEEAPTLPEGHEILARFPAVRWGWECDMYYWIIRDPSSRVYLGATCHDRFYEAKLYNLTHQINELKSYIEATQQALSMFKVKDKEAHHD